MKNLKIKILITFTACVLFIFTGCEDRLVEEPISQYSLESFFKTTAHANMAVLGIYDVLGDADTYGKHLSMTFTVDTDVAQMRGTTLKNDRDMITHYQANPNLGWIETVWSRLWNGIERANVAITRIPEMDLYKNGTEEEKAILEMYLGEAKFLRGLIYFDLVRNWGTVPLKTKPTKATDNMDISRANIKDVYDLIEKDMEDAAVVIPWQSEKASINERASKEAVLGIHARVCLGRAGYYLDTDGQKKRLDDYKQAYERVRDLTQRIIDERGQLMFRGDDYEKIFRNYVEGVVNTDESIFEVGLYNPEGDKDNTGIIGTWNSPKSHADSPYGRANSYINTTPIFYNKFQNGDIRRDVAIATYEILKDGSKKQFTGKKEFQWAPGKWRRDWNPEPPKNPNNTDINWVLLRYADVYLMHAEAQNEINEGPNTEAYNAINEVRNRASIDNLPDNLSKDAFFEAVKNERALELCFEGWRKFDLNRWGILGETLRSHQAACLEYDKKAPVVMATYFDDNKDELLPIPQRERDENHNMSQNYGY
jgi:hypothetical protein